MIILQEILESAERQFLRLLIQFKEKSFTADYPRLVIVDLVNKEEEEKKKTEGKKTEEDVCPVRSFTIIVIYCVGLFWPFFIDIFIFFSGIT